MERRFLVVPQEALSPNAPRSCVSQLRNRSVEEGDGGTAIIVIGHPLHGLVDTIVGGVHEAVANDTGRRLFDYRLHVNLVHTIPNIPHVEFVYDTLERRPVWP